ncbi:MAG: hypothetical protein AAF383_15295 [Cyanobacteria bacterium P01_A01_bin.83]
MLKLTNLQASNVKLTNKEKKAVKGGYIYRSLTSYSWSPKRDLGGYSWSLNRSLF